MPFSFHSHSGQFCKHAFGSLEEVVVLAIKMGFTHYGLSEHMPRYHQEDLYPEEIEANLGPSDLQAMFASFVAEARHLQEKYKDKICLLVGMETEYVRKADLENVKMLRKQYSLDYIVGSVHHVDGTPSDFSCELYEKIENSLGGTEATFCKYFDQQYSVMTELKPEIIGHFDVIWLYRHNFTATDVIVEKIERNIDFAVSYGAIFEINTAGASETKKLGHPYPQRWILEKLISKGARLTFSDDSHGPGDVGYLYSSLPQLISDVGIKQVYYLEKNENHTQKVVCKKLENPLNHPFWAKLQLYLKDGI